MPALSAVSKTAKFPKILSRPITFSTLGDSTAIIYDSSDTSCIGIPLPGSGYTNYAMTTREKIQHYGNYIAIGNGGISGQTTQQILDRAKLSYTTTRRSIIDVAKLRPDFVMLRCGINDVANLITTYDQSVVDGIISRRIEIINQIIKLGIRVCDTCLYGYSAAVAEPALSARKQAVVYINDYFRSYSSNDLYDFVDPVGTTCLSDGSIIDVSISSDGVHLTDKGQCAISKKCAERLAYRFETQFVGTMINDWRYEFGNPVGYNPSGYSSIVDTTVNTSACDQESLRLNVTSTLATQDILIAAPISTWLTASSAVAGNVIFVKAKVKAPGLVCGATIRAQIYKSDNSVYNIYGTLNNYFENELELSMHFQVPAGFGGSSSYFRVILVDLPVGTYDVEISDFEAYKVSVSP